MAVAVTCPNCRTPGRIPEKVVGKGITCKVCGCAFVARAPEPGADAPAKEIAAHLADPPALAHVASCPMTIPQQLAELQRLREKGTLSEQEFAIAKQAVLRGEAHQSALPALNGADHIRVHLLPTVPGVTPPQRMQADGSATNHTADGVARSAYAPIAPKFATLDPGEQHLYTFGASRFVYRKASFFPARIAGWYPDNTRFVVHLTNWRILVEPYELGKTEGLLMKALFALGNVNFGAALQSMALRQEWEEAQQRLQAMRGHALTIAYSEIANVENQKLPWYQGGVTLANILFKNQAIQPLVVALGAGNGGMFSINWYTKDFVRIMAGLVG